MKGRTPACQRGESAGPWLPHGVSPLCCWAQSRGPGSCEWRQPPISWCGHKAGQKGSPGRHRVRGLGRCSLFLCGQILGLSLHQGSEKSRTHTWEAQSGPAPFRRWGGEGEPRAATAVVMTGSLCGAAGVSHSLRLLQPLPDFIHWFAHLFIQQTRFPASR